MRLVQLRGPNSERRVAVVDNEHLRIVDGFESTYALAQSACDAGMPALDFTTALPYDAVYEGRSAWRLLPPFDHPAEPARCLVSGTGLTHKASADNRAAMHTKAADITDSERMYRLGVEGGRPAPGTIGAAPEWFYKGTGTILRAHGEPLDVPSYAEDGGEEPEVAGAYIIDRSGRPRRIGFLQANEFSDHVIEKRNYLYLAHSKLRTCSTGPELVIGADFDHIPGAVSIERAGVTLWRKEIATGEATMCHSLANIEHHHFKYETHRRPGDAHIHFYGASAFSFGAGLKLEDADIMIVSFPSLGRPLKNPIRIDPANAALFEAQPL